MRVWRVEESAVCMVATRESDAENRKSVHSPQIAKSTRPRSCRLLPRQPDFVTEVGPEYQGVAEEYLGHVPDTLSTPEHHVEELLLRLVV